MSLADFVAAVLAGGVLAGTGGVDVGALVDGLAPLRADDPDAVTAEAYHQGAVPPDAPWDETREEVGRLLGESA